MTDLTAPLYADDLAGMVALVERFSLAEPRNLAEWTPRVDPTLDVRMMVRWDRVEVTVREDSDLTLARFIAAERTRARQALSRIVIVARTELGWWGMGEPWVRCVVCRTSARASEQHTPGGRECRDTQEDRRLAHSE